MGHKVIVQKWEEVEMGMGARPDGYSIHLTEVDRAAYVAQYGYGPRDRVPAEYSRAAGTPYEAEVDDETFAQLQGSDRQGLRFFENTYPGTGGTDGWKTVDPKELVARR